MNITEMNHRDLEGDRENTKLAFTIIQSLLRSNETLSDLLAAMAHALDEDTVKALTTTGEWERYMDARRELETTKTQIEKFTETLKGLSKD